MGSSGKGTDKSIDASVGGLVWVRRRNGSWWPARILAPEELPEGSAASAKSGTPVKLLGRDDASVDWYNVEKSKRVKAFRCGEYDGCIEKAKAAASGSKKVAKYARREDAILHALEIENAHLAKDPLEFSSGVDKKDEEMQDCVNLHESLHSQENVEVFPYENQMSCSKDDTVFDLGVVPASDSELELSHSGVSFEEKSHVSAVKVEFPEGKQQRNPNDSEDDGTGGFKRMRGLEDLGMGVALSFKRKRSPVAIVQEYLKKRNRRRTLTKVLESTAMVSVPILCEEPGSLTGASDDKISRLEANGLKKSVLTVNGNTLDSNGVLSENGTLVKCAQKETENSSELGFPENGSSDHLFDVPLVSEEKHSEAQRTQIGAGALSSPSSQIENVPLGNDELIESGSASSGAAEANNLSHIIERGASHWQLKGKRKARRPNRIKRIDQNAFSLGSDRKGECNSTGGAHPVDSLYGAKSVTAADVREGDFQGWGNSDLPPRSLPFRMSRFVLNPKYNSSDFPLRHHLTDTSLYDVNVEVKGSYRPQHVPYISLMSKLNGRPIVGHPLTVEVLEDGFSDQLFSSSEYLGSSYEMDDDHPEDPFVLQSFDMVYERRSGSGGRTTANKLRSNVPRSRKNGALSKKIRSLSTLTSHKQGNGVGKKPAMENLKGPSVACVPLKVVFSRINASLSSMRPAPVHLLPPGSA